jgi:diaminohydroxyphosphoribosylaminopyrimidine deaminase / 5-amino-6-(5-phosphoribosylamino)uracil reductase
MSVDEQYMQRCLDLAIRGLGNVAPNPMVGCVVVHDGKIIGEGYHQKFGEAHAEVNAIRSVSDDGLLTQSTLYINLEPCSHFGKTPPCVNLIMDRNIPRVVIGSNDPNPLVSGEGILKLKDAGVQVLTEVLKSESDFLNRRFITFHTKQRPYIILKWAESQDGFMGLSEPKQFWFTNEESKKLTHKWRSEESGILVGSATVAIDDCELTARLWRGQNPMRMVIDRKLVLSHDRKIFNGEARTLVFNELENSTHGSIVNIKIDFGKGVLPQILAVLYHMEIQSLIIEGGATTLNHFIRQSLWDEARIFTTTHELSYGKLAPHLSGKLIEELNIESDHLKVYLNTLP